MGILKINLFSSFSRSLFDVTACKKAIAPFVAKGWLSLMQPAVWMRVSILLAVGVVGRGLIDRVHQQFLHKYAEPSLEAWAGNNPGRKEAARRIVICKNNPSQTGLDLSGLGLTELHPAIGDCPHLKALNISGNKLVDLPKEIGLLEELNGLDLSRNEFTCLPKAVSCCSKLVALNLSDNKLSEIPREIGNLIEIQGLDLSRNQLHQISPAIGRCAKLYILILSGNRLTALPCTVWKCTNLRTLNLSSNAFVWLDKDISLLTKLEALDLSGNQLTELPGKLKDLSGLRVLAVSDNRLEHVPYYPQCTTVSFSGNPCPDPKLLMALFNRKEINGHLMKGSIHKESFIKYIKDFLKGESRITGMYEQIMHVATISDRNIGDLRQSLLTRGALLVAAGWKEHCVWLEIFTDQERDDHYVMRIYNVGLYSDVYHPHIYVKGKEKTSYVEWRGISKQTWQAQDPLQTLWRIGLMGEGAGAKALYETLKNSLKAAEAADITEHQRMSALQGQKNGNCSVRSFHACIKALSLCCSQDLIHKLRQSVLTSYQAYLAKEMSPIHDGISKETADVMQAILDAKQEKRAQMSIHLSS